MFKMYALFYILTKEFSKKHWKGLHLQWITTYYSIEYRGLRGIYNSYTKYVDRSEKIASECLEPTGWKIGSSKKKPALALTLSEAYPWKIYI